MALPAPGDSLSRLVDLSLLCLIAVNLISLVLETVEGLPPATYEVFRAIELFSVGAFTLEYLMRVWSCVEYPSYSKSLSGRIRFMLSPLMIIDLLAILPAYLAMGGIDLRSLRAFRLFRILRVLKLGRYSLAFQTLKDTVLKKKEELVMVFAVQGILFLVLSSVVYFAEKGSHSNAFQSIPGAMWWAISAVTPLAPGSGIPVTILGKILSAITALLSVGIFALPSGILAAGLLERVKRGETIPSQCPNCGFCDSKAA